MSASHARTLRTGTVTPNVPVRVVCDDPGAGWHRLTSWYQPCEFDQLETHVKSMLRTGQFATGNMCVVMCNKNWASIHVLQSVLPQGRALNSGSYREAYKTIGKIRPTE